ncbi:MAG: hypothetical protein WAW36_03565 [Methylovulum miyakonense]|uniref:hypothetical protein n=1 Tax=Methylovulum miyakonense TaxID=645578 RepID=UPI003BB5721A
MIKTACPLSVIVLSGCIAVSSPASHAEWVEWLADGSVSGKFASNINGSFFSAQQLDDFLGKGLLSAGRAYQFGGYTRGYFTADWSGETYGRFEKLGQYTVGGKAVLAHKFGLGRQAPMLHLELADAEIFSASQLRSGNQLSAGLRLSSWCNEFLQGFVAYRFDDRNAPPRNLRMGATASAFDIQGHALEIGSNFAVTGQVQLTTSYSHRWGDIVSNNLPDSLPPTLLGKVDSIADDDAFPGWTYRAQGETNLYRLGLSYALWDGHAATALNYSYIDTDALALGVGYASHQIQLSVHYSY